MERPQGAFQAILRGYSAVDSVINRFNKAAVPILEALKGSLSNDQAKEQGVQTQLHERGFPTPDESG